MKWIKAVLAILRKDLLNEKRSFITLGSLLVFALVVVLIFLFAFDLVVSMRTEAASAVVWVALCFAGTLSLDRTLAVERDSDGMDGLRLAPFDPVVIFIAKVVVNWLFMLGTALIVVCVYAVFGNLSLFSAGFALVILLGTLGYITVGTLVGTLNMQMKARGPMLSVLLFPLLIPLILAAVNASTLVLNGSDPQGLNTWLGVLAGYDLLFLAAGLILFDKTLDE